MHARMTVVLAASALAALPGRPLPVAQAPQNAAPRANAAAGSDDAVAIVNARILQAEKGTLEKATVLVRRGKIEEVGPDVRVPRSATVIDAKGGTVMPGLVNANSRTG